MYVCVFIFICNANFVGSLYICFIWLFCWLSQFLQMIFVSTRIHLNKILSRRENLCIKRKQDFSQLAVCFVFFWKVNYTNCKRRKAECVCSHSSKNSSAKRTTTKIKSVVIWYSNLNFTDISRNGKYAATNPGLCLSVMKYIQIKNAKIWA